jgi:hypothetical protein
MILQAALPMWSGHSCPVLLTLLVLPLPRLLTVKTAPAAR